MKRLLSLLISFVLCLSLATIAFAGGINLMTNEPMKTYFVGFHSNVDFNIIISNGGEIKRQYKYMPVVAVKLTDKAVQALGNNPKISYIEEDGRVDAIGQVIPWGISHVNATNVHATGTTGLEIKVGIIDTGIDYTHEDLEVSGGETFVYGTTDYMDDNGHGTHVAGTVSALNNTSGVLGTAPGASLYAIKVLDRYGSGSYSDVIAGIEWGITNNMNILNMSFGGSSDSRTLKSAVNNAYNVGILLVAAAGNEGFDRKGTITYPAKYNSVIAVGAVDRDNNRASFSSVGRELELMAPGLDIVSTVIGGYASYNGTSMAAPHVTGTAALIWQAELGLTNVHIRNSLNETAVTLGDPFLYGNGLVDALAAINYTENNTTAVGDGKINNKLDCCKNLVVD
jgi:subtilisin